METRFPYGCLVFCIDETIEVETDLLPNNN